jgi:hypothetical protein
MGGEGRAVKLPNCERATVAREKITQYLLAIEHEDGGPKARFFLGFGFTVAAWEAFAVALKKHACANDVTGMTPTPFGAMYRVQGALDTPDERRPHVRSVWLVRHGTDTPALVSAYPVGRAHR